MSRQLKPHQLRGRDWLLEGVGRALLWRMGGGKTAAALAAIAAARGAAPTGATWIVAPRLVADTTWQDEPAQWPQFGITPRRVRGSPEQRRTLMVAHLHDVLLLHYEQLVWAAGEIKAGRLSAPDILVLDEASALHNPATQRWRAAVYVGAKATRRWLLTGSPFGTGGLVNAWGPVTVMDLGTNWGRSFYAWRDQHFTSDTKGWRWFPKPETAGVVQQVLARYGHTLRAEDYPDIPTATVRDWLILPSAARDVYDLAVGELRDALRELGVADLGRAQPILGVLQQLAGGAVYHAPGSQDWRRVHDVKLDRLEALLGETGPALVYCQYRHEVARLRQRWPEAPILAGGIAQTDVVRAVKQWNAGLHPLMIAHPAVAAYGLNLQHGGAAVIWYSLPWSIEHFQQGNARLARPGQEKQVAIILLLMKGTIDVAIDRALQDRGTLETATLQAMAMAN